MKKSLFAILILFLLSSCFNNSDEVLLSHTNLDGVVPKQGNFTFTFDEEMVPDSLLGVWEKTKYVSFEPEIKGEFKWVSANELVFSPIQKLSPATEFTAEVEKEVLKYTKGKKLKIDKIKFQTALLSISSSKIFWTKTEAGAETVKLTIELSEIVDVADFAKQIDLKSNGVTIKKDLLSSGQSATLDFYLPEVKKSEDDLVFDISLPKGLKPIGGNLETKEPFLEHSLLYSPYNLIINDVEMQHDGSKGTIKVTCSQPVKALDLKNFVSLNPNVAFKVETTENGFTIESEKFLATEKYTLTLKTGLLGEIGGKLKSDFTKDVTFGQLKPEIKFEKDRAFYLSATGNRNIEVKIASVNKVKVIISKVYENNLLASRGANSWFNTSSNYFDEYYDEYYYDDYYYYNSSDQVLQDIVFEKTYNASDFPKVGGNTLFKLDFSDKLKDYKGIYHIDIRSDDDRWLSDSRFVSVSDLGLIVKDGQNFTTVFVNSIATAKSIAGVKVKVYGQNNQLAGEGTTDADGFAKVNLINKDIAGFAPAMVTATLNGDFNVIMLRDTKVKTSDFELGGYRNTPNGLQTYIYPERDLYRPGEMVHFATIVRSNEWNVPGKLPVKVEIRTPNGKLLKTLKKTLNNEGSFDAEFQTSSADITGNYTINIFSSNDVFLASQIIKVEEFMPDRIKVSAEFEKENYNVGEKAILNIDAQNLFGTPAANRNYEVEVNYRRTYISPKGLENYNFDISDRTDNFETTNTSGKTDANGKVTETIQIPSEYKNMGRLNAVVYSTVFDETNRPVNRKNVLNISTQNAYFGIGNFNYYVATNTKLNFPLVAIDKNDKVLSNARALVKVIKYEYKTILNKDGDYYTYNSQKVEKVVLNKEIILNGKQYISYNPVLSGEYEIRISTKESPNTYVSSYFYAYSWGSTSTNSFEVNNEGKIDMTFDKENYEVGEKAKVLFKTPFDGRILVTVEKDDVLQHFYINTQNRAAEFSFLTTEAFLPNVYITATLFKAHKQTDFPLTVAHGFASLDVKQSSRKLKVEIQAPANLRSRTKQTIKVKTKANAKLTIAVVDEGILQVSRFKTPDPYEYFYQKRALLVDAYDIYPFLFKEIAADNAGAGDEGFDLSKRVNPLQNKRVKLVSFWSGIVETNSSGEASFEVDIPQFSGSLRVMAVVHQGNSFGSAEKSITVADPIVMSSSIPRFFSPGDTAIITTTLTNTTTKNAQSKATITCTGPLQVISATSQSVAINSKAEQQVTFKIYVKNEIGQGKIKITCNALGENFIEETDITIRSATSLLKETGAGTIAAGNFKSINLNNDKFLKNTVDYKLVISKNPMVEFAKDLDYLVQYPHGCSEQTISAAFPQIYFAEISKALYKNDSKQNDIVNNINTAINRLKMRQIYNGGILTWDSGSQESWWTTAYAAHFLIEAKKSGYNIDDVFLNKMLEYLTNRLKSKETVDYYYDRGKTKRIAPKEVAYSLYVLALAGKSDVSLMNYYKSNTGLLTSDCQYLLAAAYALSGDKAKAKEMLPAVYSTVLSDKQFGGSFYSPIRDEAIALNALLEIDQKNPQVGTMAMHISKNLKESKYMNTQERIFSLLALGKIAKKANESTIAVNVNSGGKKITNYNTGILTLSTKDIQNGIVELDVKGTGILYYFYETEGISKDGSYKEEDNFLKIRKSFYDRNGKQITTNQFKINDLVVVKLSLNTIYNKTRVENVVITDILPACFEIENSRTDEIPGTSWIKNQSRAAYTDVRDDRINLFDDLYSYSGASQDYYYVVRVVSKGTYRMGPVGADAMYNGEYYSYSGGGTITVK